MSYISKFKKNSAWRKQVLRNLVTDTILYERIETSLSLARHKEKNNLTKLLAKLISWAKKSSKKNEEKDKIHFRKLALGYLVKKKQKVSVLDKLFKDLALRYKDRSGGYSRIIKIGNRIGDNNQRVIFALV